jgi:hypothetical protein
MQPIHNKVHPARSPIGGLAGWITTRTFSYVEEIESMGSVERIHLSLTEFDPAKPVVRKCVTAPSGTCNYRAQRIELFRELRHT